MIQIIDNEIIQIGLPKVGTMQDGSTVSGYNLLDSETLKAEGWSVYSGTQFKAGKIYAEFHHPYTSHNAQNSVQRQHTNLGGL